MSLLKLVNEKEIVKLVRKYPILQLTYMEQEPKNSLFSHEDSVRFQNEGKLSISRLFIYHINIRLCVVDEIALYILSFLKFSD